MRKLAPVGALLCMLVKAASAHRLDEYLQATILSIEPGAVSLSMRLVPGVSVASSVIASIDRNADGAFSESEQRSYAEHVMADLLLKEDGHLLKLRVVNAAFPDIAQMNAGTGEIELTFAADLPAGQGSHELIFENHHQAESRSISSTRLCRRIIALE